MDGGLAPRHVLEARQVPRSRLLGVLDVGIAPTRILSLQYLPGEHHEVFVPIALEAQVVHLLQRSLVRALQLTPR